MDFNHVLVFLCVFGFSTTVLSHLDSMQHKNSRGENPETCRFAARFCQRLPEECETVSLSLMDGQES